MTVAALPTIEDVVVVLAAIEPATANEVHDALPDQWARDWSIRGTVRNRLLAAERQGLIVGSGGRPERWRRAADPQALADALDREADAREADALRFRRAAAVLRNTATAAGQCCWCGRAIDLVDGRWVDAGTGYAGLVFCTDQDETHDGQHHEPLTAPAPPATHRLTEEHA